VPAREELRLSNVRGQAAERGFDGLLRTLSDVADNVPVP
jgi:hypothetical protein